MCSYTRQVNAFGTRMTIEEVVSYILKCHTEVLAQKKGETQETFTTADVAHLLEIPPAELRKYAYVGIEMDARSASKLGNKLRQIFGDVRVTRTLPFAPIPQPRPS